MCVGAGFRGLFFWNRWRGGRWEHTHCSVMRKVAWVERLNTAAWAAKERLWIRLIILLVFVTVLHGQSFPKSMVSAVITTTSTSYNTTTATSTLTLVILMATLCSLYIQK